jgi:hypothetical protein
MSEYNFKYKNKYEHIIPVASLLRGLDLWDWKRGPLGK